MPIMPSVKVRRGELKKFGFEIINNNTAINPQRSLIDCKNCLRK